RTSLYNIARPKLTGASKMKAFLKIAGGVVLVVFAIILGGISYLSLRKPAQRAASAEKFEATPERLSRGNYLVNHVSDCLGCHSDHLDGFGFPVKPGTEGQGGLAFDKKLGFPGLVAAQNITPDPETGLGKWPDGEIARAIREGVGRDGDGHRPVTPRGEVGSLSDDAAN